LCHGKETNRSEGGSRPEAARGKRRSREEETEVVQQGRRKASRVAKACTRPISEGKAGPWRHEPVIAPAAASTPFKQEVTKAEAASSTRHPLRAVVASWFNCLIRVFPSLT
jgi:hypothetical protein